MCIRDSGYRVFASSRYDKKTGERLIRNASAYIIEAGRRYSRQQPAVHMLGYVNPRDFSGAAGIEKMCDKELSLLNKKIFTTADVKGNLIPGRGLVVSTAMEADSYVKKGVATTLDAGLQKKVEEALAKSGKDVYKRQPRFIRKRLEINQRSFPVHTVVCSNIDFPLRVQLMDAADPPVNCSNLPAGNF